MIFSDTQILDPKTCTEWITHNDQAYQGLMKSFQDFINAHFKDAFVDIEACVFVLLIFILIISKLSKTIELLWMKSYNLTKKELKH